MNNIHENTEQTKQKEIAYHARKDGILATVAEAQERSRQSLAELVLYCADMGDVEGVLYVAESIRLVDELLEHLP